MIALFLVWSYPAVVGPSARGVARSDGGLPWGYHVSSTEYVCPCDRLLYRLEWHLFGENASIPYPRLRQKFESTGPPDGSAMEMNLVVRSSTRSVAAGYLASMNRTFALSSILVKIPRLGESQAGWGVLSVAHEKTGVLRHRQFLRRGRWLVCELERGAGTGKETGRFLEPHLNS